MTYNVFGGTLNPTLLLAYFPQPDTSLCCPTMDMGLLHRIICLFTPQFLLVLSVLSTAELSWVAG